MTTTTVTPTARDLLNTGNPALQASVLEKIKMGDAMSKIKVAFTGLTSAAAQDITTAAAKAAGTITGITLKSGENLPPIGEVVSCRVTAGTLAAGDYIMSDAGGTAKAIGTGNNGVALLSDDGKTITFQAAVTGFVLVYYPGPSGGMTQSMAIGAP